MGLIAGGMDDGTINIWDASSIVTYADDRDTHSVNSSNRNKRALLSRITRKSSGITALAFNQHPSSSNLLASNGHDHEILITSLDDPSKPTITASSAAPESRQLAEITQTMWNTEVAHIVVSSAGSGSTVVWDLSQNKTWCELRESSGGISFGYCVESWSGDASYYRVE